MLTLVALLPLTLGFALAPTASAIVHASSPRCEIRAIPISGGLRLEGVVRGAPGLEGSYRLLLHEQSLDNVSQVGQGGTFIVGHAGESVVATADLGSVAITVYRAEMRISTGTISAKCDDRISAP
jgi:hypothetical protein